MFKSSVMIRLLTLLTAAFVVAGMSYGVVAAATSRGYTTTQSLANGALVSLDPSKSDSVVAATPTNSSKLIGAVVPGASATIEFTTPGAGVQVAESGSAAVLVSDINGTIKTGDHITVSPLSGIGMKATASSIAVGIAQANFSTAHAITQTVKDNAGVARQVHIAQLSVSLAVGAYTPPTQQQASYIPVGLQTLADTIAGHATEPWRILASLAVMVIALVVIGALIYSSVHSSLTAIGRNPLSSPAIFRSLFQLVVVTLGLLFVALLGVYFLLAR